MLQLFQHLCVSSPHCCHFLSHQSPTPPTLSLSPTLPFKFPFCVFLETKFRVQVKENDKLNTSGPSDLIISDDSISLNCIKTGRLQAYVAHTTQESMVFINLSIRKEVHTAVQYSPSAHWYRVIEYHAWLHLMPTMAGKACNVIIYSYHTIMCLFKFKLVCICSGLSLQHDNLFIQSSCVGIPFPHPIAMYVSYQLVSGLAVGGKVVTGFCIRWSSLKLPIHMLMQLVYY